MLNFDAKECPPVTSPGTKNYFMGSKSSPLKKEEVQLNPDSHIDQDFPGYPHLPADKKSITPVTVTEEKLAGAHKKKSKKVYGG